MCKISTCGAPDGAKSPGKMKHKPGEPCAVTSRMHGSERGGWKRTAFMILPGSPDQSEQVSVTRWPPTLRKSQEDLKKQVSRGMLWFMQTNSEPMDTSSQFCPNLACRARGKMEEGNIVIHDRKRERYRCKICKQTFSAKRGTMFEGKRSPRELIVIVITLRTSRCHVQAVVHANAAG